MGALIQGVVLVLALTEALILPPPPPQKKCDPLSAAGRQISRVESRRQSRVAQQVRTELAYLIRRPALIKCQDRIAPEILGATSVLEVDVSPDLLSASAHVTTRGGAAEKRAAFAWLVRNERAIRYALAKRMRHSKRIPDIRFQKSDVTASTDLMTLIDKVASDTTVPSVGGFDLDDLIDDDIVEDDDPDDVIDDDLSPEDIAFFDSIPDDVVVEK